jgi:hypothetical protein
MPGTKPVIGALVQGERIQQAIAREVALHGIPKFLPSATTLLEAVRTRTIDMAILELCDEMGWPIEPLVEAIAAHPQPIPLIVYDKVSASRVTTLRGVLLRQPLVDFVVRSSESLGGAVHIALQQSERRPLSTVLLPRLLQHTPTILDPFVIITTIKAPYVRRVGLLASMTGSTLRTIERTLARSGWASPTTIAQSVRALDVAWLMSEYGLSSSQVQIARKYSHPSNVRRLIERYAGTTPAALHAGQRFTDILDDVVRRMVGPPRPSGTSRM